jgi:hypothetical protein
MRWFVRHSRLTGMLLLPLLFMSSLWGAMLMQPLRLFASSTHQSSPYASYESFAQFMAKTHKAPFEKVTPYTTQQWQTLQHTQVQRRISFPANSGGTNVKVNRDLNPWNKLSIAAAVNPSRPQNYLVLTNDYREEFSHQYYHVSQTSGKTWHDDALTSGIDATTSAPYNLQTNPGAAFDTAGNSFFSMLSANVISDATVNYSNFDTQVDTVQGFNNANYSGYTTSVIDYVPCNGILSPTTVFNCPGQLQRPSITVDTQPASPNLGSIYVYYTYFCNGVTVAAGNSTPQAVQPCIDNGVTIAPLTSAVLESHSAGAGMPFSKPQLVSSTAQTQAVYPTMVIDQRGTPHIFFEDFATYPVAQVFEATLQGEKWQTSKAPLVNIQYITLGDSSWSFFGNSNPGCSSFRMRAYCAFAANKVNDGPNYATPSVYLLSVDLTNTHVSLSRVNSDPPNDLKSHFFPWASTNSRGQIYVGWYDNRHDPLNAKVEYFVGKSIDAGKTFQHQQAVSDTAFNPCIGSSYCSYFGDYDQLVTGSDDVTHATWADTRDGASAQLYSQAITW